MKNQGCLKSGVNDSLNVEQHYEKLPVKPQSDDVDLNQINLTLSKPGGRVVVIGRVHVVWQRDVCVCVREKLICVCVCV